MWNEPSLSDLEKLPEVYSNVGVEANDLIIHQHYFLGNCDWYVAEYDRENRLFFGYANLGDSQMAEWGYTSFDELRDINVDGFEVDRDLYWKAKRFTEIDRK